MSRMDGTLTEEMAAIRAAYIRLEEADRAQVDGFIEALLQAFPGFGLGESAALELAAKIGILVVRVERRQEKREKARQANLTPGRTALTPGPSPKMGEGGR